MDSFIGGSIQANFKCIKCNNITEKRTHCDTPSLHISGNYYIDNDMVNLLNTVSAVFRLRHALTFAVHKLFNDKGFFNLHTPIITSADAEGAGRRDGGDGQGRQRRGGVQG